MNPPPDSINMNSAESAVVAKAGQATDHHRGSDASDASNGHLMVYGDARSRRSSISFDKIRQISLSYSLQSEDAAELDVLEPEVATVVASSVGELLANGCSDIIMTNDELKVVAADELGPNMCTTNGRGQQQSVGGGGSGEGCGRREDEQAPKAPQANPDAARLIGPGSKNGLPPTGDITSRNEAVMSLEGRQQQQHHQQPICGRNPFVVCADDDEDQTQLREKLVACGPRQETRSPLQQQSRSPTRNQQQQLNSITNNNNSISSNNNSTISLKLARNMGANIIIDSDNRIALVPAANDRHSPRRQSSDINQDLDQFSSDNSSSCWDCASGLAPRAHNEQEAVAHTNSTTTTTTLMTPLGGGGRQRQLGADLLETDYRRAGATAAIADAATGEVATDINCRDSSVNSNLNNRLDRLAGSPDRRQYHQEGLVKRATSQLTSDHHRHHYQHEQNQPPNPRDPNARDEPASELEGGPPMRPVGVGGGLGGRQQQKGPSASYQTTTNGGSGTKTDARLASDNSRPFFDIAHDGLALDDEEEMLVPGTGPSTRHNHQHNQQQQHYADGGANLTRSEWHWAQEPTFLNCSPGRGPPAPSSSPSRATGQLQMGIDDRASPRSIAMATGQPGRAAHERTYGSPGSGRGRQQYRTAAADGFGYLKGHHTHQEQPQRSRLIDQPLYDGHNQQQQNKPRTGRHANLDGSEAYNSAMAPFQTRGSSLGRRAPLAGATGRHFDYVGRHRHGYNAAEDDDDGDPRTGVGQAGGGYDDDIDWALTPRRRLLRPGARNRSSPSSGAWSHRQNDDQQLSRVAVATPERRPFLPECRLCQLESESEATRFRQPHNHHHHNHRQNNNNSNHIHRHRSNRTLTNEKDECEMEEEHYRQNHHEDHEDRLELALDETKQISIIIGTPKRRRARRQPNSGSSTASTSTPPLPRQRADDFYYYDYRPYGGGLQAWGPSPRRAAGEFARHGRPTGQQQQPSFEFPAGPEQRHWARPGTFGDDYESMGRRDNSELGGSAAAAAAASLVAWRAGQTTQEANEPVPSSMKMIQKPREMLSRRSTISSSSEGAIGAGCASANDRQDDALPALVHNGAQFQRRPTGPFELGHYQPAGGQQQQSQLQQQQMIALAQMRLQQPQHPQQQSAPDDHWQSGGEGQPKRDAAAATCGGGGVLPPPPASEQINLGSQTNKEEQAASKPASATDTAQAGGQPPKTAPPKTPPTTTTTTTTTTTAPAVGQDQKPIKLRNLLTKEMTVDSLYLKKASRSKGCNESSCLGALIDPVPVEHRVRTPDETRAQAREFIDGYYASIKRIDTPAHKNRLKEIEEQIQTTDTYYLRETELIYGAKLAWRNAPRCIGRIQWSKLQVFDARCTRTADEMFEAICNHIKYATNKGNLRSAITIFPQRVKSTQNDWRVWNPQLIGYAGYKDKDTGKVVGDPLNVQLTEICQKLGWQGKGGPFDILPLVLQANGGPPKLFKLPEELVLRVKLRHPKLDWFAELNLEWYAVPAVSSMMLDVGGLQFTACPFNGWYMVTEVGARDLGDASRYNMLEPIAQRMGLNTTTNISLWRDQALTQLNLAVLHSYQQSGVTIVDHHTACETFMTHLKNEQRLRGGCPADWVWLVPPTAGSTTQVFHQEMVNYHLLPNYEYLQPAWKNFDWVKWERLKEESRTKALTMAGAGGGGGLGSPASKLSLMSTLKASTSSLSPLSKLRIGINQAGVVGAGASPANSMSSPSSQMELTPRHLRFKEIARAVKFTSKLFGKALSRRIKATILYATETGKSERFANKLAQTFSHAFNVHLMSMSDYDMTCLEHEALLLIVTSTFGNGDPPENGELFAKHLAAIKMTGDSSPDIDSINSVSTNPFFQMLSEDHKDGLSQAGGAGGSAGGASSGIGTLGDPSQAANDSNSSGGSGDSSLTSGGNRELDDSDETDTSSSSSSSSDPSTLAPTNSKRNVDDDSPVSLAASNGSNEPDRKRTNVLVRQEDSICQLNQEQQTNIRPLSNVRFAVFALGSTAYPHFCAFGRYVDQTLGELGAERILKCCCGDELSGQEKALTEWSNQVFRVACDVFCLTDTMEPIDDRPETIWTPQDVRFEYVEEEEAEEAVTGLVSAEGHVPGGGGGIASKKSGIIQNLAGIVGKKILPFTVKHRVDLHEFIPDEGLQTIRVDLDGGLKPIRFQAGDHIGIYPVNKFEVVDKILKRIEQDLKVAAANADPSAAPMLVHNMDKKVSILLKRGKMDPLTQGDDWIRFDTLPLVSIREALTRYLDITNPPNQDFLSILARQTSDPDDKKRLQQMARNFTIYEEWKNKQAPSLLSTLEEFKTVCFDPALITQIPPMKPRFYSVSGTSITLTLGVVRYKNSKGEPREGLCSNYLNTVPVDPKCYVFGYVRSAPAFHMPQDKTVPMLLISAGTGIAPFRAFWQQRYAEMSLSKQKQQQWDTTGSQDLGMEATIAFGRIEFYFGCRNSRYILYKDELDDMHNKGVLSSINIAFSRPLDRDVIEDKTNEQQLKQLGGSNPSKVDTIKQARKRMYVQDKLLENHKLVFKSIVHDGAHIYVCGDVAMADGVYKTLAKVINMNLKANNKLARQSTSGHGDQKSAHSAACMVNKSGKAGGSVDLVRSGEDGESLLMNLRNLNRYHEDIFGAKQV